MVIQDQLRLKQNLMNHVSELSYRFGSINNFKGSSLMVIQDQLRLKQNLMNHVSELSCRVGSINNFKGSFVVCLKP